MQLSEKDKQALQEKIKEQRQAMWSGKQSTSEDSEEKAGDTDQDANPSENTNERPTDAAEAISPDVQSDSSLKAADKPASTEARTVEKSLNPSSVESAPDSEDDALGSSPTRNSGDVRQTIHSLTETEASTPEAEETPIAGNTEAQEEEQQATERVFWETLEQEGGSNILTWKIVLAVIGVVLVLVGVGVYLGFLFAG